MEEGLGEAQEDPQPPHGIALESFDVENISISKLFGMVTLVTIPGLELKEMKHKNP